MPSFTTLRFGELEYRSEDVVTLPEGLVGMPQMRRWLLLDLGNDQAMKWMQSLDRGDFGFPVTQPYFFLDEYDFDLPSPAREKIGNTREDQIAVMIITTVHPGGAKVTGNMLAPLVIDTDTRKGLQLTLEGEFDLRQEINYFKFGLAVGGQSADNTDREPATDSVGDRQGSAASAPAETVTV